MKKTASKPLRKSKNTKVTTDKEHREALERINQRKKDVNQRPTEEHKTAQEFATIWKVSITTARDALKAGIAQGEYERVKCGAYYWYMKT